MRYSTGGRLPSAQEYLTPRETEVAALLAAGYTDREIGALLRISRRTAESHSANVRAKLGLKSRRELIRRTVPAFVAVP